MQKGPTTFSIDLIQQEDGSFKILEFNRGIHSGYEGYKAVYDRDMWHENIALILKGWALEEHGVDTVWCYGHGGLGYNEAFPCLEQPGEDTCSKHVVTKYLNHLSYDFIEESKAAALFDAYPAFISMCNDKGYLAAIAEKIPALTAFFPEQRIYAYGDWVKTKEAISADFKDSDQIVLKDSYGVQGMTVFLAQRDSQTGTFAGSGFVDARMRFKVPVVPGHKSLGMNTPDSFAVLPYFVVQERVRGKKIKDTETISLAKKRLETAEQDLKRLKAEVEAAKEEGSLELSSIIDSKDPNAYKLSLKEKHTIPALEKDIQRERDAIERISKKEYQPTIRAVVSMVPTKYGHKLIYHGGYYKMPKEPVDSAADDFARAALVSDVMSLREGAPAGRLDAKTEGELKHMLHKQLQPVMKDVLALNQKDVIKDLLKSKHPAKTRIGLAALLSPTDFWGEDISIDKELEDLVLEAANLDEGIKTGLLLFMRNYTTPDLMPEGMVELFFKLQRQLSPNRPVINVRIEIPKLSNL